MTGTGNGRDEVNRIFRRNMYLMRRRIILKMIKEQWVTMYLEFDSFRILISGRTLFQKGWRICPAEQILRKVKLSQSRPWRPMGF
jgi:hypothetical protein